MKNANRPSRSMIREFTKRYLMISLIPVVSFIVMVVIGGFFAQRHIATLLENSTNELNSDAKAELEALGQQIIQDKARSAAKQVAIFLSFNTGMDMAALQHSDEFSTIAMQQVGKSGYVCMYEAGTGIMRIHPNPDLIDKEMAFLSDQIPSWWAIFERSLSGKEVSGHYDWIESDGSVRKKFMTMTPVASPLLGKSLMVAATTYIDEFSAPVAAMASTSKSINANFNQFLSDQALTAGIVMVMFLLLIFLSMYLIGRRSALQYMLPIVSMAKTAEAFGDGHWSADNQPALIARKDEIGVLARAFESMRLQLQKLFQDLENRVSELKLAQHSLQESETHFRGLFDGVPVGLYRTTFDGRTIDANPTLVKMLGYPSKEQFLCKKAEEMYANPEDRSKWKTIIETSETNNVSEMAMRRYDRSTIWVENHSRTVRGSDRSVRYIEGSLIDITERKRAEEALRESEERYRALTELLPIAIFETNDQGCITFANQSAYQLTGYDQKDFEAGLRISTVIAPQDHAKVAKSFQRVMQGNFADGTEYLIQRKDGSNYHGFINARPTTDRETPGLIGYIFDLTNLKEAQKALRDSEEKLVRSKKMESLGLLAGGVAHDLNNILSGIVSYPELLLMDLPEGSKLKKPIETMQESGNRAAAIVQDLLTVARGVATTKEPLDLNEIVNDYFRSPEYNRLQQFHPAVTIETHLDCELLCMRGSSVHIRKVIMNLVSNASESIEGSGRVAVSTMNRYIDAPLKGYDDVNIGEYVVLAVSDSGSGISPDDLERIFEPFYTKKVMGRSGTGLGLAVVWNTVQDHNGYIDVTSARDGTTFELYFPATRDKATDKNLSVSIDEFKGNGEMILVVDDVESQREISCNMLNALGYNTEAVSSGDRAVEYVKEHAVDLILLDMIMAPGMNGRQTYERIIEVHPDQKAIIASGYAETDDVKAVQNLGAGAYLKKPLTLGKIGMAVKEELSK